ncbi:PREDICTED: trichohyalin-like [Priapulus caudatus]|uniref:Trichohyalin-like n=1 Tax=Priapulus caudatus TaxID=37621 RepID=A0ABM1E2G8_PRICU|nr:PREDICTED: trichohyalin-like [Priapulus caudatus]
MVIASNQSITPRCLPMTVAITQPLYRQDEQWVGLGFLLGFLFGSLVGIFIALICCKNWYNKRKHGDVEHPLWVQRHPINKGYVHMVDDSPPAPVYQAHDNAVYMQGEKVISELHQRSTDISNHSVPITELTDIHDDGGAALGMSLLLTLNSSEEIAAEVSRQDVETTTALENNLWKDRNMLVLAMTQVLLNRLHKQDKISNEAASSIQLNLRNNLNTIIKTVDQERCAKELLIRGDERLSSNPAVTEDEMNNLHRELVHKMNSLIKEEESNVRRDLVKTAMLSENEANDVMGSFAGGATSIDQILSAKYARESQLIQQRLSERLLVAELGSQKRAQQSEEVQANIAARKAALTELAATNFDLRGKVDALIGEYERNVRRLNEKHEAGFLKQQAALTDHLQQKRAERMAEREKSQAGERQSFIVRAEKLTQPDELLKAYQDFELKQNSKMSKFHDDTDKSEHREMAAMLMEVKSDRDRELQMIDEAFINKLQDSLALPSADVTRLIQMHLTYMRNFTRAKEAERQQYSTILQDGLRERQRRWQTDYQSSQDEQRALLEQQDSAVTKVMEIQMGLDDEARKQILLEHRHNMQMLSNQLLMSKQRQYKILVRKLNVKRANLAVQRRQHKHDVHSKSAGTPDKLLLQEISMAERVLHAEHEEALTSLRQTLATETQQLLKEQDQRLAAVIGRLQVGRARRRAAIQQQDNTIGELQLQLGNKQSQQPVTTDAAGRQELATDPLRTDHILHQHMKVSTDTSKAPERRVSIRRVLNSTRLDVAKEKAEPNRRGGRRGDWTEGQTSIEQLHRQKLDGFRRDMRIYHQRQKEELDQQMAAQLHRALTDQKKSFLVKLAAITNMSEAELQKLVEKVVANGRGDSKQAAQLVKDLLQKLKKAKLKMDKHKDEKPPNGGATSGADGRGFESDV